MKIQQLHSIHIKQGSIFWNLKIPQNFQRQKFYVYHLHIAGALMSIILNSIFIGGKPLPNNQRVCLFKPINIDNVLSVFNR